MTHTTNFLQVQACERCCGALYILTESPMVTAFEDGKARYYHYNCYQHSSLPTLQAEASHDVDCSFRHNRALPCNCGAGPVGTPEQEETPEHSKHCPYRHSGASCTCGGDPLNSDVGYLNTSGESLITPESAEEQAREMLYRAGVDIDIRMTSGDLVEIANLIAERTRLVEALAEQNPTTKTESTENPGNVVADHLADSLRRRNVDLRLQDLTIATCKQRIAQLEQQLESSRKIGCGVPGPDFCCGDEGKPLCHSCSTSQQSATERENAALKRSADSARRENEMRAKAQHLLFRVDELEQQLAQSRTETSELQCAVRDTLLALDNWKIDHARLVAERAGMTWRPLTRGELGNLFLGHSPKVPTPEEIRAGVERIMQGMKTKESHD